ncbi:MAG: homoserine kinase [Candidatus Limivicinus sp.]|nr:homoserine kinase [Clostridiales bacterium]MDY6133019.1 homoserine kinase [Candidatus Limivicinus sp.]
MKFRIPASSANLGPGFDCFGIAWQCYNEIEFIPREEGLVISGCEEKYCNEDNLAYKAYRAVMAWAGQRESGLEIRFGRTDIPVSRGMGSSAALIVGGVVAANAIHGLELSGSELLAIATSVEGHPDNIAPALFGGFTVSAMDGIAAITTHFPISEKLFFTLLIPDFELSTELARSVLPVNVSRQDAIFNISRSALLIKALERGDRQLMRIALEDKLHQPYRTKLIQGFETAETAAKKLDAMGICISGAGSTLLCIADRPEFSAEMEKELKESLPGWKVLGVKPDLQGVKMI